MAVSFAGSQVVIGEKQVIRYLNGHSISLRLPKRSEIAGIAGHGSRFAVTVSRGSYNLDVRLYVVTRGVARQVASEPDPYSEHPSPVWSPDGSRIAITRAGDLWTIKPDGSDARQLSHTQRALENDAVWSPDSQQIAYSTTRHGVFETYTAPALGGRELRVTHTSVKRRDQYASKGTRPFGWRGDRIAVISYNAIGTVASTSGAMTTICETAPRALFVSGSW